MTQSLIRLTNVHKSFGAKKVLQGLNLDVYEGESLVIIGGSGSGKSVMLKCILGLISAEEGSITLEGQELMGASTAILDAAREKVSMLFQGSALFDSIPVWENIVFGLLQKKAITRQKGKELAIQKLADVGLPKEVAELYPAELSGGMQRRVALARAVASNPKIIFFDEPTTGLDPIMAGVINNLIRTSVKELAAITITHDMASARYIADRVAMIYQGQIVWQGPIKELDHSNNPYIDQFIHGKPAGPIQIEVR
jgi:phospholipid/cholesterol/gamma-HCH transport system ATP-binding protein